MMQSLKMKLRRQHPDKSAARGNLGNRVEDFCELRFGDRKDVLR